jgi:hypothetical protein
MQKRDALEKDGARPDADPESGAPHTPRVSGEQSVDEIARALRPEVEPESSTRPSSDAPTASEPSDTLLSAGKPADRLELLLEDRLALVDEKLALFDERLRELDGRLFTLEQRRSLGASEPRQRPWLWIAFLIALVVVFQLLQKMR